MVATWEKSPYVTIKKKITDCLVLKLTLYIRNVSSFSYKPKTLWNPDSYNLLSEIFNLIYIPLKIGYFELGHDYEVTDAGTYFGMYGKKRPLAILWYQLDVSGGWIFKFNHPPPLS